ncbi:SpoIIE family protein phosphatase [Streptomyces cylindrosporus]|uniref:SpoIIE family protein phosphatase n=1 Tax=Streptomyces cylindrosporus TaxID=2927583 RepID=A0ABS9YM15_9ACTN|nr:SpoIIE family protein phosphatase [Streptomyces cylindrosporus]MCI3278303.1 SpoIIE family protein phosphatase [Streptomyces cylindrosporus]
MARTAVTRSALRPGVAELVATELATNLLRHAHPGGYVLTRGTGDGIELLSVDHGPGMAAPPQDGYPATAPPAPRGRGLNAGLNVIRRHATEFDWYSTRNGTVVYARLGGTAPAPAQRWRFGAVNVPLGGDGESGDAWAVTPGPRPAALLVDGLGHGPDAARAARAAVTAFERQPVTDLDTFIRNAHEEMRATRGGVLGVCLIDPDRGQLTYAAVGNVTGRVLTGSGNAHLLDRPGTLGTHLPVPRTRLQRCAWEPGATLVLVSDGIRSGWSPEDHPQLLRRHPAIVAAVVHRDHCRPTDDATVLVVRDEGGVP